MALFFKSFEKLKKLEYKDCCNALHKNKTENYYTFMGLYEKYHKDLNLFKKVKEYASIGLNIKQISSILYCDEDTIKEVTRVYIEEYWDKIKGSKIKSQLIADEIFIFGVNVGIKTAIKKAQKIVGVKQDGIVGSKTLQALNSFNEKLFSKLYDKEEISFYELLALKYNRFKVYLNGWINRAKAI